MSSSTVKRCFAALEGKLTKPIPTMNRRHQMYVTCPECMVFLRRNLEWLKRFFMNVILRFLQFSTEAEESQLSMFCDRLNVKIRRPSLADWLRMTLQGSATTNC